MKSWTACVRDANYESLGFELMLSIVNRVIEKGFEVFVKTSV